MNNPEALELAEKHGWTLKKVDKNTKTYFFARGNERINFFDGKRSFAVSAKGIQQRYLRGVCADEVEAIFKTPGKVYGVGYSERIYENRNPMLSRKDLNKITE